MWSLAPVRVVAAAASVLIVASCTGGQGPHRESTGGSSRTAASPSGADVLALSVPRAVHKATVLSDRRVLFSGGCALPGCEGFERAQVTEIFDPVTRRFARGPSMTSPRAGHSATLLQDGRVLLVGGYSGEGQRALATAEVYDPIANAIEPVGELSSGRADHTATLLEDGSVLIAGGATGSGPPLATSEVFTPATGRFRAGPSLSSRRSGHAAVLTKTGVVLVAGTGDFDSALATTDVLTEEAWSAGPTLRQGRVKHAAVALPNDTVLVIGGGVDPDGRELLSSTEVVDIAAGRSRPGPELSEGQYKLEGAVTTLADGRVVVAGGQRVEVYDPRTGKFTVTNGAPAVRRSFVSASAVGGSTVLVAGGYDSAITPTADVRLVRLG